MARELAAVERTRAVIRVSPALVYGGERFPIRSSLVLGSGPESDVQLPRGKASNSHAVVERSPDGAVVLRDTSSVGLLLNGDFIHGGNRDLRHGDQIQVGGELLHFADGESSFDFDGGAAAITIGSSDECDLQLEHPMVAEIHARIVEDSGGATVHDDSGGAGLFVNGSLVRSARLDTGSQILVGPFRIVWDGRTPLVSSSQSQKLHAISVGRVIGERTILQPTTISVAPGELLAIIGESGAGKSTLLRILAATEPPDGGAVMLAGEPLAHRRFEVGYVPQDEIVHRELKVSEALRFAAVLRLPRGATEATIEKAVDSIARELGLSDHLETLVDRLSGGQRKRIGVACELVNRPAVLLLDEPTTGLDPGLEQRSMQLFRRLARGLRSVVLVTHATKNLGVCDKVLVLGVGGYSCFLGSPDEALEFFEVSEFDEIYGALEARPASEWVRRFEARPERRRQRGLAELASMVRNPRKQPPPRDGFLKETMVLLSRYGRILSRDRKNLFLLVAQAPILGLLAGLIFPAGAFSHSDEARSATNLLFLLTTIAVWLGAISASREVVRERALVAREAAVGVRISAYLTSKVGVLWILATIQVSLMLVFAFLVQRPDFEMQNVVALWATLVIAACTAVTLGLGISAYASTENQSTSLIPLALIPQLLLGGAIVAVASMTTLMKAASGLIFTRWFFAGAGSSVELNDRIAADPVFSQASEYGATFFDLPLAAVPLMGGLFGCACLGAAAWLLKSRDQRVVEMAG